MINILFFLLNFETWFYGIIFTIIAVAMSFGLSPFMDKFAEIGKKKKVDTSKLIEFNKLTTLEKAVYVKEKFYVSPMRTFSGSSYNVRNDQSKEYELSAHVYNILDQINKSYPAITKKSNELADVVLIHVDVVCTDKSLIDERPYSLLAKNTILVNEPLARLLDGLRKLKNEEDIKIKKIKDMEEEEKKKLAEISRAQYNENMNEILKTIESATKVRGE